MKAEFENTDGNIIINIKEFGFPELMDSIHHMNREELLSEITKIFQNPNNGTLNTNDI